MVDQQQQNAPVSLKNEFSRNSQIQGKYGVESLGYLKRNNLSKAGMDAMKNGSVSSLYEYQDKSK